MAPLVRTVPPNAFVTLTAPPAPPPPPAPPTDELSPAPEVEKEPATLKPPLPPPPPTDCARMPLDRPLSVSMAPAFSTVTTPPLLAPPPAPPMLSEALSALVETAADSQKPPLPPPPPIDWARMPVEFACAVWTVEPA